MKRLTPARLDSVIAITLIVFTFALLATQNPQFFVVDIPKTWDMKEIKRFHLPPPDTSVEVTYAPEEYYNSLPEHVIYKTYPIYVKEKAPEGYLDSLRKLEPEIAFDLSKITTQEDWIKAGEAVFHWPVSFIRPVEGTEPDIDQAYAKATKASLTAEGIYPYANYIVKEKRQVIKGDLSCANCHSRVLEDGTLVVGGQGTAPFDVEFAYAVENFHIPFAFVQKGIYQLSHTPWTPEVGKMWWTLTLWTILQ